MEMTDDMLVNVRRRAALGPSEQAMFVASWVLMAKSSAPRPPTRLLRRTETVNLIGLGSAIPRIAITAIASNMVLAHPPAKGGRYTISTRHQLPS